MATGTPTRLPLFSPRVLKEREADPDPPTTNNRRSSNGSGAVEAVSSFCHSIGYKGLGWVASIVARQRQRLRRLKRSIVAKGLGADKCTAIGVGGATVYWGPRSSLSRRLQGDAALTPSGWKGNSKHFVASPVEAKWRHVFGGDHGVENPVNGELGRAAPEKESGVVGHVWVSLKLRDPSMLVMRAIRQWNMARDEASVQQRRAAQLEAKRCSREELLGWGGGVTQPARRVRTRWREWEIYQT